MKLITKLFFLLFAVVTVQAQITVGDMVVGQGVSSPDDWQDYINRGIYVDVNTSACGFTKTPHYLITLESVSNSGYHWDTNGVPAIYNATATGFRVYLKWNDHPTEEPTVGSAAYPNPLRKEAAKERGWVIRWTAISTGDCSSCKGDEGKGVIEAPGAYGANEKSENGATINENSDIRIFPNPTNTVFQIASSKAIKKSEIYNLNGDLLMSSTKRSIDISTLDKGEYVVKMYLKDDIVTKKVIKS